MRGGMDEITLSEDDLAEIVRPMWLAAKPSVQAQTIRAQLVWPLDDVPDYVWDLVDIAAQRGIEVGKRETTVT